jgi:carbon-monoxide dehydrogenase medium subunit
MQAFDHFTPDSLDEALELLSRFNGRGYMIAGGTDLMLKMKSGMLPAADARQLEAIINIKRLPELKGMTYHEKAGLRLGALTTLRELTRSPIIRDHYPSLAQAAAVMASEQIRSFATVGGNLCNASPSADLAPPLMALEGVAVIATASGERNLPLEQFFLGPGKSALAPGELLREVRLPAPSGRTIYLKHSPRAYMDIAIVGVAVRLHLVDGVCEQARVVLAAVAPVPLPVPEAEAVLRGKAPTTDRFEQAARIAAEACSPIDDIRGSAWYRRRMVEVLTRRAFHMLASPEKGPR